MAALKGRKMVAKMALKWDLWLAALLAERMVIVEANRMAFLTAVWKD